MSTRAWYAGLVEGSIAPCSGFVYSNRFFKDGKAGGETDTYYNNYQEYWDRERTWKYDRIRLSYPTRFPDLFVRRLCCITITAEVILPCPCFPIGSCELDVMTLERCVPSRLSHTLFPLRFERQLLEDAVRAVRFCDMYDNARTALDALLQMRTTWWQETSLQHPKLVAMRRYLENTAT